MKILEKNKLDQTLSSKHRDIVSLGKYVDLFQEVMIAPTGDQLTSTRLTF
jgi:hypothetical protein